MFLSYHFSISCILASVWKWHLTLVYLLVKFSSLLTAVCTTSQLVMRKQDRQQSDKKNNLVWSRSCFCLLSVITCVLNMKCSIKMPSFQLFVKRVCLWVQLLSVSLKQADVKCIIQTQFWARAVVLCCNNSHTVHDISMEVVNYLCFLSSLNISLMI